MELFKRLKGCKENTKESNSVETESSVYIRELFYLAQYLRDKQMRVHNTLGAARSCPVDGFLCGVEDTIKLIERNINKRYDEGLFIIKESIHKGDGLEYAYPLCKGKQVPLWINAYINGIGSVVSWIEEYDRLSLNI